MAVKNLRPNQIARPAPQTVKVHRYPAPIKGVDSRIALTEGSPLHCVYTFNLVPFEFGMAVRKGYREQQINVTAGISEGVHTVIPFDGVEETGVQDKLFVVTNEGIWDVTIIGAAPILMFTFADQSANAGYGPYCHYVNGADEDVLLYADNFNGLFTYDTPTNTWSQPADIVGPVVENIRWVVSHKQRLWVVEENSTIAWYLPIASNSGQATEFFFGNKFRHGGNLEGLFNWSVDGGNGVDDMLVAVSRAGDVLPYKGADPSSAATWDLVGSYFIGAIPKGPYFGSEHGGNLYLLSTYGLISMNDLLQGVDSASTYAAHRDSTSLTGSITSIIRERMVETIEDYGWEVTAIPSEGGILVSSPRVNNGPYIQFIHNISTNAWGIWRGVPLTTFDTFKGAVVFGTEDNRVCRMDVTVDNQLLTPIPDQINGNPINFSLLTSYQALAADAIYKRVKLIRADFLANGSPTFTLQARYDYDISEVLSPAAPPAKLSGAWDVGAWDLAVWGAGSPLPFNGLQGSWGSGRYVAIAMFGETRDITRFIGFDVLYDTGGPLI
jgi:hypothetical protein